MKVEELAAYCEHIEREFFRFKGRPGTLSPSDFSRVRKWFEAGLGLNAVLEGIGAAFEARAGGHDLGIEEVNSLSFCEPFVEQAARRRRSQ